MDTIKAFVGIDVSKKKLDIALLRGDKVKPKAIKYRKYKRYFSQSPD